MCQKSWGWGGGLTFGGEESKFGWGRESFQMDGGGGGEEEEIFGWWGELPPISPSRENAV